MYLLHIVATDNIVQKVRDGGNWVNYWQKEFSFAYTGAAITRDLLWDFSV